MKAARLGRHREVGWVGVSCQGHVGEPVVRPPDKNVRMAIPCVLGLSWFWSVKLVLSCYHDYRSGVLPPDMAPLPAFGAFLDITAGRVFCSYSFFFLVLFHLQGSDFHCTKYLGKLRLKEVMCFSRSSPLAIRTWSSCKFPAAEASGYQGLGLIRVGLQCFSRNRCAVDVCWLNKVRRPDFVYF